jgi:hypothetical protein
VIVRDPVAAKVAEYMAQVTKTEGTARPEKVKATSKEVPLIGQPNFTRVDH